MIRIEITSPREIAALKAVLAGAPARVEVLVSAKGFGLVVRANGAETDPIGHPPGGQVLGFDR